MKSKGLIIGLIVFFSVLLIGFIVFFVILLNKGFNGLNINLGSRISNEKIYEKTYEETFENIIINSDASKIEIKETDKNTVEVEVYGKEKNLTIKDSTNLEIEYKEGRCNFFCLNREIARIVVYLPSEYENKIKIKNDAGNIEIGEFKYLNLVVDADAGNVSVGKADIVDIENNAGNIKIDTVNSAKITSDVGNIKINEVNEKFDIENNCGNIEIEYVNITKDSSAKTDTGNITINHKNDIYVEGTTDVGKVNIDENNRKAEIKLDLKTNVGTINVK